MADTFYRDEEIKTVPEQLDISGFVSNALANMDNNDLWDVISSYKQLDACDSFEDIMFNWGRSDYDGSYDAGKQDEFKNVARFVLENDITDPVELDKMHWVYNTAEERYEAIGEGEDTDISSSLLAVIVETITNALEGCDSVEDLQDDGFYQHISPEAQETIKQYLNINTLNT